jgi:hypothetical protein
VRSGSATGPSVFGRTLSLAKRPASSRGASGSASARPVERRRDVEWKVRAVARLDRQHRRDLDRNDR